MPPSAQTALPCGLQRATRESITIKGIHLQLSYAPALSSSTEYIVYLLDPEPEMFTLACTHLYARFGHVNDDADPEASLMRDVAIVGVGHHPDSFAANKDSWDTDGLRELRRKHFLRGEGNFLGTLLDDVIPRTEAFLLGTSAAAPHQRAILGCSLSSLLALRSLLSAPLRPGGRVCDALILGSPSLPLVAPGIFDEVMAAAQWRDRSPEAAPASVLIVVGEGEADPLAGNGIPAAAEVMAHMLRAQGHEVTSATIAGEDHGSLKPSLISRGMGWLEKHWASTGRG